MTFLCRLDHRPPSFDHRLSQEVSCPCPWGSPTGFLRKLHNRHPDWELVQGPPRGSFSTHLTPHFSLRLRSPVWLLVTGPTPLNSSPTPPVYAWSVNQDLISWTARPELASWTIGLEKTFSLFNSSMG